MKTVTKFFTNDDKEVLPGEADYAVQLEMDDSGNLVRSTRFTAGSKLKSVGWTDEARQAAEEARQKEHAEAKQTWDNLPQPQKNKFVYNLGLEPKKWAYKSYEDLPYALQRRIVPVFKSGFLRL